MSKDNPFEMPPEMFAFAEKGMQQARSAFETWVAATRQAVDTAQKQAAGAQAGAREMSELAMHYAERNIASGFQFAQKLLQAKDVNEVAALQAEYVKSQMEALSEQASEFGKHAGKFGPPGTST
jgi:phasin